MTPQGLFSDGGVINNPGNGTFRLKCSLTAGICSVTISQPDPSVPLVGTLTLSLGSNAQVLNLSTDRWVGLAGPVPWLDVTIAGVDPAAEFSVVLL